MYMDEPVILPLSVGCSDPGIRLLYLSGIYRAAKRPEIYCTHTVSAECVAVWCARVVCGLYLILIEL